ncbi:N-acetylmuramoyl-L-alanine amidase [Alkalihalophilus lindianensis]|uniref:N-acetylmuramoyl-L-alanine amidase n=1 Tax=Alkalihalophilus lindianensis TaxID=1630542 RepID=A0ABU3X7X6_9BACI|nr:N-acetylmuramoyl-L-alanine amidase [Alkalihalophilus lindianensis]MDV2683993.1 N-acetylmuramoyl-L-alanine amidase [Alkalihalophilus lindianensis]
MSKLKIVIDLGHGGKDPGAVFNGLLEKNLALSISRNIKETLTQNYDVLVRMTRDSDKFLSLEERAKIANNWGADYFLSVHLNAGGGTGFETYIHPNAKTPTKSLQEAVHNEIISRLDCMDRGMKRGNFAVLRLTQMPAVLTENLFLDHTRDARQLKDPTVLKAIAQGHVNGLQRLLKLRPMKGGEPVKVMPQSIYRLLVNGKQIGAFGEKENLLKQVTQHLGTANKIELEQLK